jgi:hypothetical protein
MQIVDRFFDFVERRVFRIGTAVWALIAFYVLTASTEGKQTVHDVWAFFFS